MNVRIMHMLIFENRLTPYMTPCIILVKHVVESEANNNEDAE